jgi:Fur family transcriptional regulator, ferric uptake regulator
MDTLIARRRPQKHHHLICRVCGKQEEIGDDAMKGMVTLVKQRYGFLVEDDHLVLHGICADCRSETGEVVQGALAGDRACSCGDDH